MQYNPVKNVAGIDSFRHTAHFYDGPLEVRCCITVAKTWLPVVGEFSFVRGI